jgi:eukaryotic-like serine/threonine-protein kinase
MSRFPEDGLPPGTRIGRYEILRGLSRGASGELYLARTIPVDGFQKQVALKRIHSLLATDPAADSMLLEEARLMATLHHPNIAQVYDAGRDRLGTYFTMEYIHGHSLAEVLRALARKGRGLSLGDALYIVTNVAAGLHYAHEKKTPDGGSQALIHRDVSPNNIMLSHNGAVKLIDFGIAKLSTRGPETAPGTIKGNVRYMSPEQYTGSHLDRSSDIFTLGIVLFELTTGTRWLRERDDHKAMQLLLHQPLPRPSDRRTGYSSELERIVLKALKRSAAERHATAQQLQVELEAFALNEKLTLSNISLERLMHSVFGDGATQATERVLGGRGATTALQYGDEQGAARPVPARDAAGEMRTRIGHAGPALATPPESTLQSKANAAASPQVPRALDTIPWWLPGAVTAALIAVTVWALLQ